MTRRRFLAIFGGLLAAVTAAFPVLRRPKPAQFPVWDGKITFNSEAIVNGVHVKPGTTYHAGNQCGKTEAGLQEMRRFMAAGGDSLWRVRKDGALTTFKRLS